MNNNNSSVAGTLSMQEAIELERQAHLQDQDRQNRIAEKKRRLGLPTNGEVLTRQEREARMLAFMYFMPFQVTFNHYNQLLQESQTHRIRHGR